MEKNSPKRRRKAPAKRVHVTMRDGRDRKGPARHCTLPGVTLAQAEKMIRELQRKSYAILADMPIT